MNKKIWMNKTFFKYTIFYLFVMAFAVGGLYLLIDFDLREKFQREYVRQMELNIENHQDNWTSQEEAFSRTSLQLTQDIDIITDRYFSDHILKRYNIQKINRIVASSPYIKDIIYYAKTDTTSPYVLSTNYIAQYENGCIDLQSLTGNVCLPIDELQAKQQFNRILIQAEVTDSGTSNSVLYYIPKPLSKDNLCVFILSSDYLRSTLKTLFTSDTVAIAIEDTDNQKLYSTDDAFFATDASLKGYTITQYKVNYQTFMVLSDQDILNDIMDSAMQKAYVFSYCLGLVGLVCFGLFVSATYLPLYKFHAAIKRYIPSLSDDAINFGKMESAFNQMYSENERLSTLIQNYRYDMQRTLLSTIVAEDDPLLSDASLSDFLFRNEYLSLFSVAHILCNKTVSMQTYVQQFAERLPENYGCFSLESTERSLTLLICWRKGSVFCDFRKLLQQHFSEVAYAVQISEQSDNPMAIARLFEDLMPQDDDTVSSATDTARYPYRKFDEIALAMEKAEYFHSEKTLSQMLDAIIDNDYPEFFVRCILLDTLTLLVGCAGRASIDFSKYGDLYNSAVELCRTQELTPENLIQLKLLFCRILNIIAKQSEQSRINKKDVVAFIHDNYMDSSFSMILIGSYFHISPTYFSYWFKKEFSLTPSDYIWNVRLEQTVLLMQANELTNTEISEQVGYLNYTSFRRKFKDSTGKSPSEYRALLK